MSSRLNDTIRTLFKSGGVLFVGLIFQLGFSFISTVIIARVLPRSDFGSIALATTVAMVGALLAELGLPEAVSRYLPRATDEFERRSVLVTGYTAVAVGVAVGVLIFVAAPFLATDVFRSPSTTPALRIFAFVVPLITFHRLTMETVAGMKHSIPKVVIENFAKPIARFSAVLVVAFVGVSVPRMALAYLVGWLVPALIGAYYVYTRTSLFDRTIGCEFRHQELLAFSLPLLLAKSMSFIFGDLDTLMLGYFADTSAVGIYNVVYPIGQLLTVGLTAFSFVFMPTISELHAEGAIDELTRVYQVVTKWVFVITLPVFLVTVLFPTMTITISFGAKYQAGATTLSVLTVGFFVSALFGLNSETLSAIGHTRHIMYVNICAAALNTILNLVLIPTFGHLGAAVATTTTFVMLNVVFSALIYREFGIIPVTYSVVRPALVGTLLVGAIAIVIKQYFRVTLPLLVAFFVVFLVAYAVLLIRVGAVEEEEVMLAQSVEERFGVDLGLLKRVWSAIRGSSDVDETD